MQSSENSFRRDVPNLIHVNSHVYGKDALCYPALEGLPIDQEMKTLAETHRYHPHVFILPPWRAIYHTDAERRQDWKESVFTYNKMIHTYRATNTIWWKSPGSLLRNGQILYWSLSRHIKPFSSTIFSDQRV